MEETPDVKHLKWAIEQRAEIQLTLLTLYEHVRGQVAGDGADWFQDLFQDHLIAAAFSLWRAVFLADKPRDPEPMLKAQTEFLSKVLSTNAITFADDQKNSPWAVTFYLENAKHRVLDARGLVLLTLPPDQIPDGVDINLVERLVRIRGREVTNLRFEWEAAHSALRRLFKVLNPETGLPVKDPQVI